MWKNLWCNVFVLALLFLMSGCLGHSVKTSGDEYLREYGDLEIENDRGIQNINIYLAASSRNATDSDQEVRAEQKSQSEGNLGWNGGAVSKGDDSVATGLQTLDYLIKADTADAVKPPVVIPAKPIEPPVVKPEIPVGRTVEQLDYHKRTNGSGDGEGDDPLDRPTWYGAKNLNEYPATMRVVIQGCTDQIVDISGTRPNGTPGYEDSNLTIKQSDVPGRGMGVLFSNSCMSKDAAIEY